MMTDDENGAVGGAIAKGKLKYLEKTRSNAALSTTNYCGHCSRKPATNRLSYAKLWREINFNLF
jgi:hypothetical protein